MIAFCLVSGVSGNAFVPTPTICSGCRGGRGRGQLVMRGRVQALVSTPSAAAGENWCRATTETLRTKLVSMPARQARPQRQTPPPPSADELALARGVRDRPRAHRGDPRTHLTPRPPPGPSTLTPNVPEAGPAPGPSARPQPSQTRFPHFADRLQRLGTSHRPRVNHGKAVVRHRRLRAAQHLA